MRWLSLTVLALSACSPSSDAPADPIQFLNLRSQEVTATEALISFQTSAPVACEVRYGVDALELTATDQGMGDELQSEHELRLYDLSPDSLYQWQAQVESEMGVPTSSELQTFSTLPMDEMTEVNVAEGAEVIGVSSNWADGANSDAFGADLAVDGSMSSAWASNGDGDDAWIEVDLGDTNTLTAIGLRSRDMSDGSSIVQSFSLTLDDGTVLGPYDTPDSTVTYRFELDTPVDAKRVRLDVISSSGGNTGLRELQLWGQR